jgi:serine/threonine protein kinase
MKRTIENAGNNKKKIKIVERRLPISNKYYNRIYNQNEFNIRKCLKHSLKNLKTYKPLDSDHGRFGTIFPAKLGTKKLIVKVEHKEYKDKKRLHEIKENYEEEVKISYLNAEYGLGPKIYDAFGINYIPTGIFFQYIIMDKMYMDCEDAFSGRKGILSIDQKQEIIEQMCDILVQQATKGIYCIDIKPANFLVDFDNLGLCRVKMIDFGIWCTENKEKLMFNKVYDLNKFIMTNFLQLYFTVAEISSDDTKLFLKVPLFRDFFIVRKEENKKYLIYLFGRGLEDDRRNKTNKDIRDIRAVTLINYAKIFILNYVEEYGYDHDSDSDSDSDHGSDHILKKTQGGGIDTEAQAEKILNSVTSEDVYNLFYASLK